MKKTTNKAVLIGAGMVGMSYLYSSAMQGIAEEYAIIDLFPQAAEGNKLDVDDALAATNFPAKITHGGYEQVKDADIIVITAGRPQKPGETRLDMVADNAKIMKSIAEEVKSNGFDGITIIASNPVDVMTAVYQKVTGFNPKKVISSSCSLDSSRLRVELANILDVSPTTINTFVLGEHGDSSVSAFSHGTVAGIPFLQMLEEKGYSESKRAEIHTYVYRKAYEIIERKKATYYGIGAALAEITKSVLRDERKVFSTGALLSGEYGQEGVYAGVPSVLGAEGIIRTIEFPLSEKERAQFEKSITTLKDATSVALEAIK